MRPTTVVVPSIAPPPSTALRARCMPVEKDGSSRIKLRVNIPRVEYERERLSLQKTTDSPRTDSRSISEVDVDVASMSMSLGEDNGDEATQGAATIISSPSSNVFEARYYKARGGSTPVSAGAPMSTERAPLPPVSPYGRVSPRMSSKRPRYSNDWVEDEVHPMKALQGPPGSGRTMGKRLVSEMIATTMRTSLQVSPIPSSSTRANGRAGTEEEDITAVERTSHRPSCTVGDSSWPPPPPPPTTTTTTMSFEQGAGESSLLKRTLSGTYSNDLCSLSSPMALSTSGTTPAALNSLSHRSQNQNMFHHVQQSSGSTFGVNGMPPSSPSDPSPLHDLRKAALMRSRLLNNASSSQIAQSSSLPARRVGWSRPSDKKID